MDDNKCNNFLHHSKEVVNQNKRFTFAYGGNGGPSWAVNDNGITLFRHETIHTLNELHDINQELYEFRLVYNALLFNNWHKHGEIEVYKSHRHHDGEPCFDGEWFIVVAILPNGKQITNHYHNDYWDFFEIPEYDKVKDEYDGHTPKDVIRRLKGLF